MATITTINGSDLPSNSRADINSNFANLNSDKIETSVLDTDTALTANSDSKIATQKAVKTYIDTSGGSNASTTTRGIVEEATQAEVDAGTAAGGTGARLFINPSTQSKGVTKSMTAGETINGATLPVPVYQNTTDNEYYACDGNDTTKLKFQGFAISNGVDAGSLNVKFNGIVSGFTGLDEGVAYYLSDTVGTIQNTPGTYAVLVGVAISTTELLIQKGKRYANGNASFTDAGGVGTVSTSAVTLGFRPAIIRMTAVVKGAASGERTNLSHGSWVNGVYASIHFTQEGTSDAASATSTSYIIHGYNGGTEHWQITITSVTATGFTISADQRQITPQDIILTWEAEGEL